MRYLKWLARYLGRAPGASRVIGIALALTLPSLFAPLFIDEYVQAARWRTALGSRWGLLEFLNSCFVFASGDAAAYQREMGQGLVAWWQAPDWKIAFWRPLAAATHAFDLLLWPGNAVLMHVHSLLWFLGLLWSVNALYRRFLAPRAAHLALALFAWDDARGQVLSWIAKRNALMAGVFGVCTIIAYDKWRRDGWRPGAWVAPLLLAAGLLSAEMALATTGFLFAYAVFVDRGSLARRMARLTPYLIVVVIWQAAYATGGYGAKATVAYIHPLVEALAYAARLIQSQGKRI